MTDLQNIINFVKDIPRALFQESCLNFLVERQLEDINKTVPILKQQLIIYSTMEQCFITTSVLLVPNILVISDQYLVLSSCKIIKMKNYVKSENIIFGIQLFNGKGSLLIFFKEKQQYNDWVQKLKSFCKLSNFSNKFTLLEQMIKDYYVIQHKKTKKYYTALVYPLKNNSHLDILNSEIQTLRSIKHSSLLDLKWVFEDIHYIYLVYEHFRCEKLLDLLNQGLVLDQTQLASVILQILQSLKFLKKNSIYHGNITPNNILINTQSTFLQLFMINMTYMSRIEKEPMILYLKNVADSYVAPEIREKFVNPSIETDLYQIGVLLYFMTFFTYKKRRVERLDSLNEKLIDDAEFYLSQLNKSQEYQYRMVYCTSQLDLMRRLLDKQESRIKLEEALKHHWFINIKQKLKPKVERRKQHLPSLRTIIELCEQNDQSRQLDRESKILDEESVMEENNLIEQLMFQLEKNQQFKRPSKENHEKLKEFQQFKTQVDQEKDSINKNFLISSKSMV